MVILYNPARNQALASLGSRLREQRLNRNESQEIFAARLSISPRSLRRMELGDSGISIGVWAEALDLVGHLEDLDKLIPASSDLFERPRRQRKRAS
jgi:transcriptional regulator with XRE-family HTH domain